MNYQVASDAVVRVRKTLVRVVAAALMLPAVIADKGLADDRQAGERIRVAVLGDSLATGAATHPALAFDHQRLWKVMTGEEAVQPSHEALSPEIRELVAPPLAPPRRAWPHAREFTGGPDWFWRNFMHAVSAKFLNTEEYSWGYLLARARGHRAGEVLIAATDGARVQDMVDQAERVLSAGGGLLPSEIYVLYSGNDLCALSLEGITSPREYGEALEAGLRYLAHHGAVPESGTVIWLPAFLNVAELIHAEAILNKELWAYGKNTTCRALRADRFVPSDPKYDPGLPQEAWYFPMVMPPNIAGFCPTLFAPAPGDGTDERLHVLANRIRDFREQQKEAAGRLMTWLRDEGGGKNISVRFLDATGKISFAAPEVGPDCFHLSLAGQERLAMTLHHAMQQPATD